mgnify:CR=1 FL=1
MADIDGGDIIFTIRGDASQLEAELERTSEGLERVGDEADSAGGGLRGLSSVTRVVSSEFSKGASAVTALTRGIGGMSVALGPAVAVVGAMSIAVKLYQADQEEAARVQAQSTAITEGLTQANLELQAAYQDLAVAAGDMTKAERDIARVRKRTFTENLPAVQELSEALGEQVNKVMAAQQAIDDLNPKQRNYAQLNELLTAGLKAEREEMTRLTGKRADLLELIEETTTVRIKEIELTNEFTDAERAATIATRLRTQAMEDQRVEAEKAKGKITEDAKTQMEALAEAEETTAARAAVALDTLTMVGQASGDISRELADEHSKASKLFFRVSQAQALTDIAINTAVGVSKSFSTLGPIGGAIGAVVVGAIGATQAGIVMSQSPPEHLGTSDALMPDERMSFRRTQNQEITGPGGTVNSMGSSMVSDLNRGRFPNGGGAPVTAVIGRTHLDQELFKNGRRGTSRYSRQLRRNPHPKQNGGW